MSNFCLVLNLRNKAITQYHGFSFNAITESANGVIASKASGLFNLGYQTSDNGLNISAFATLYDTDLDIYNNKRLWYLTFRAEGDNDFEVEVIFDKKVSESLTYDVPVGVGQPILSRIPTSKSVYGCFIALKLKNVNNSRFALNYIDATYTVRNANIS